jgi:hypothetical protein
VHGARGAAEAAVVGDRDERLEAQRVDLIIAPRGL